MRLAEAKRELAAGRFILESQKGAVRLSDFWNRYYLPHIKRHNRPCTVRRKQQVFDYHGSFFGQYRLREINKSLVERYKEKRLNEGAVPSTINRETACLRHALNVAVQMDLLAGHQVSKIKMLDENPDEAWHVIPDDAWEKIVKALKLHRRPFFQFLWYTGMRLKNALELKWSQVDLEKGTVRIPSTATKHKKELVLPLPNPCIQLLKELHKKSSSEYVFVSEAGTPLIMRNVQRSFKYALKKAKLPTSICIHDIRHTYATKALEAGVDVMLLKELLGHSTITMALRYFHVSTEKLKHYVNKIFKE